MCCSHSGTLVGLLARMPCMRGSCNSSYWLLCDKYRVGSSRAEEATSCELLCMYRNPLRRSHSFALRDGIKGTFMSRGSQPNLVSYADDEANQASSNRDENRKKGGHMRNVSVMPVVATIQRRPHCYPDVVWQAGLNPNLRTSCHIPYDRQLHICQSFLAAPLLWLQGMA